MRVVTDARAKRAARRVLGAKARRVRRRRDGSVVVEVDGRVLLYRHRPRHTYFRVVVPCAMCGERPVTWRGAQIASARDLADAHPPPLMCDACLEERIAAQSDSTSVSEQLARRRNPGAR